MFQESIRSTQWEIQHQKQHVKQHVKHWFFATVVAGAGKGNFQLPDTAAVSPFYQNVFPKKCLKNVMVKTRRQNHLG